MSIGSLSRPGNGLQSKLLWLAVAALGAFSLAILALSRGESVNAAWLVIAAVCTYCIAYRFYGLWIANRVLGVHLHRSTPAHRPNGLPEFARSNVEERWFKHARFRHQSHRMMSCTDCHAAAPSSAASKDVLIPSMDNCKQCHNSGYGGVRNDCIGCHDYHHSPQRMGPSGLEGAGLEKKREPEAR